LTAQATSIDNLDHDLLVGVLSLHTPWSSTTKGAVQSKVNVLLAVNSHNERWYVHYLLANPAAAIPMLKRMHRRIMPASACTSYNADEEAMVLVRKHDG